MNTDDALKHVGGWGKFQKRMYALICIATIPNACMVMHFVFSHYEPDHRCQLPEDYENSTFKGAANDSVLDFWIPDELDKAGNIRKSQCRMYNTSYGEYGIRNQTIRSNTSEPMTACTEGYIFDLDRCQMSAVTEFSMVCENDWQAPLAVAAYHAGSGIGSLASSLADRFGRRPMFLFSCVLHASSPVIYSLTWNSYSYIAAGFICAVAGNANYLLAFVAGTEMTDAGSRNFMAVGTMCAFSIGYCIVAALGYLLQNWRWYLRVVAVISALAYLPNFWLFPESPRWLAQKGKTEKTMKVLKEIAKTNGKLNHFEELIKEKGVKILEREERRTGIVETLRILFRSGIGDRCIVLSLTWLVVALTYYYISLFSKTFSNDRFLNVLFAGLSEFPASGCGFFFVKIIGRPRSMFLFMMLCGLTNSYLARTVLSVIGKAAVSAEFHVVYLMGTEIVPTLQRSYNMSICSACARVGSFMAPFLMYAGKIHHSIPNLVIGVLAVTSGILCIFFLPETKGASLPDSVEEAKSNKRIYGMNLFKKFDDLQYKIGERNNQDDEAVDEV